MRAFLIIVAALLSGCASTTIKNELKPLNEQAIQFARGSPYIAAEGKESGSVFLLSQGESRAGERLKVELGVINKGSQPFNFGPENISVTDQSGGRLVVVPYEIIAREIEAEIRRKKAFAAYMAMSAMNAQTTTTSRSQGTYGGNTQFNAYSYGQGQTSNTYGQVNSTGIYSGYAQSTTINPAANAAAARSWLDSGQAAQERLQGQLGAVSNTYLRTNTVQPGQEFFGFVYIEPSQEGDPRQPDAYAFTVNAASDEYRFMIGRTPQQK